MTNKLNYRTPMAEILIIGSADVITLSQDQSTLDLDNMEGAEWKTGSGLPV